MTCERCGVEDANLQVKVMQDGEPVELVLCAVCVMVEAHRNVMALPPASDDGAEETPLT